MKKVLISDGIISKEITFSQFQNETDIEESETPYPFQIIEGQRFYFNSFLFL